MTRKSKKNLDPKPGSPSEEEEPVGSLAPNPELEDALRAAVEAVEDRREEPGEEEEEPSEAEAPGGEEALDPASELENTNQRLLRLQADFENFRRRSLAERRDIYQYGHENLVKDLLSTVDNLDRAIGHARESGGGDLESLLQGVELVQREFLGILENHSICEVEALGKAFDPALHEAMAQLPDSPRARTTPITLINSVP